MKYLTLSNSTEEYNNLYLPKELYVWEGNNQAACFILNWLTENYKRKKLLGKYEKYAQIKILFVFRTHLLELNATEKFNELLAFKAKR